MLRLPPWRAAKPQKYCKQKCYFAAAKPVPPSQLGAQAKHDRALVRYREATTAGAQSLREIQRVSGLSQTTIVKLRRELDERGHLAVRGFARGADRPATG